MRTLQATGQRTALTVPRCPLPLTTPHLGMSYILLTSDPVSTPLVAAQPWESQGWPELWGRVDQQEEASQLRTA